MDFQVILVAPGYPPERLGGAEVHAARLGDVLERKGLPVLRLTPEDPIPPPDGRSVLHLHVASTLLNPVLGRLPEGWVPVVTLHDASFACPQLFYARATGKSCTARDGRRCPVCMHRNRIPAYLFYPFRRLGVAPLPGGAMKRLRDWFSLRNRLVSLHRRGARFVFPSAWLMEKFREFLGTIPRGVHLPNFPLTAPRSPSPDPTPPRVFGWMGTISPGKGVDLLLEGWARCGSTRPGGKLVLWGKPASAYRTWWDRLWSAYRNVPGVEWRGTFPPEEAGRVLDSLNVVLFPSRVKENCPLTVVDALARGKRVLASRLGGLPELLPPEALFPPTVEGVCDAIRRADTVKPAGLPSGVPSPGEYAARLLALYEEVIRGG